MEEKKKKLKLYKVTVTCFSFEEVFYVYAYSRKDACKAVGHKGAVDCQKVKKEPGVITYYIND